MTAVCGRLQKLTWDMVSRAKRVTRHYEPSTGLGINAAFIACIED